MNTQMLKKLNRFGKVGKGIMTVLLILAVVLTVLVGASAIYTMALPKDAVQVAVTDQAVLRVQDSRFSTIWGMLADSASYATAENPTNDLKNSTGMPAENTRLNTELHFFNHTYTSATVRSDGAHKVIDATSDAAEYRVADLAVLLIFATLFCASVAAALVMLQRLFQVISVCASPFCNQLVTKLRAFGYTLLPVAVFASIGETLAVRFLSAGSSNGVYIQWGVLLAFVVVMCLVTVFRYGTALQKESDETL